MFDGETQGLLALATFGEVGEISVESCSSEEARVRGKRLNHGRTPCDRVLR